MGGVVLAESEELKNNIYNPGNLKPRDSALKVNSRSRPGNRHRTLRCRLFQEEKYRLAIIAAKEMW
jgi:hypothetical protein